MSTCVVLRFAGTQANTEIDDIFQETTRMRQAEKNGRTKSVTAHKVYGSHIYNSTWLKDATKSPYCIEHRSRFLLL